MALRLSCAASPPRARRESNRAGWQRAAGGGDVARQVAGRQRERVADAVEGQGAAPAADGASSVARQRALGYDEVGPAVQAAGAAAAARRIALRAAQAMALSEHTRRARRRGGRASASRSHDRMHPMPLPLVSSRSRHVSSPTGVRVRGGQLARGSAGPGQGPIGGSWLAALGGARPQAAARLEGAVDDGQPGICADGGQPQVQALGRAAGAACGRVRQMKSS